MGDLGFKVFVDASGATQGANEYEQAAARVARATRAMAQAAKGAKSAVLQNAVSGRGGAEYRTMMKQIDAYKAMIDVTRKLAAAKRELQDVDIKQAARDVHEAVKAMAQITKTTDYIGSPQLNKVKEMVEMYSRLANAARDLAKANRELEASRPKAAAPKPADTGYAKSDFEREAAIRRYQYRAYAAKNLQKSSSASGDDVTRAIRDETAAYKDLVEAIGKASAAEEKRAIDAGISHDLAQAKRQEAEEAKRLAAAEREAIAIHKQAQAFEATQIAHTEANINANNRYIESLEATRFAAQDLRNYLTLLAKNITRVRQNKGRLKQTLAQSSYTAWHKYYKADENAPNALVSYYQQGSLAALCLDLTIRQQSGGAHSLDTVMRQLYRDWLATQRGIEEQQWQTRCQEITGLDLADFFQMALYTTDELPLADCLHTVGIGLQYAPLPRSHGGGLIGAPIAPPEPAADLGARFTQKTDHAVLTHILNGGSAENAALCPQDKITAVNGRACTNLAALLADSRPDDIWQIHYFRHGILHQTVLTLQAAAAETALLYIEDEDKLRRWLLGTV